MDKMSGCVAYADDIVAIRRLPSEPDVTIRETLHEFASALSNIELTINQEKTTLNSFWPHNEKAAPLKSTTKICNNLLGFRLPNPITRKTLSIRLRNQLHEKGLRLNSLILKSEKTKLSHLIWLFDTYLKSKFTQLCRMLLTSFPDCRINKLHDELIQIAKGLIRVWKCALNDIITKMFKINGPNHTKAECLLWIITNTDLRRNDHLEVISNLSQTLPIRRDLIRLDVLMGTFMDNPSYNLYIHLKSISGQIHSFAYLCNSNSQLGEYQNRFSDNCWKIWPMAVTLFLTYFTELIKKHSAGPIHIYIPAEIIKHRFIQNPKLVNMEALIALGSRVKFIARDPDREKPRLKAHPMAAQIMNFSKCFCMSLDNTKKYTNTASMIVSKFGWNWLARQ